MVMSLAVKVYEAFKDDERKAKVLSEVIDELESRIAPLRDVATKGDLELTKLALQKEIEEVRKEIEEVRGEVEKVRLLLEKRIEEVKASIVKWVVGLLVVQTGVIVSVIALL